MKEYSSFTYKSSRTFKGLLNLFRVTKRTLRTTPVILEFDPLDTIGSPSMRDRGRDFVRVRRLDLCVSTCRVTRFELIIRNRFVSIGQASLFAYITVPSVEINLK